MILFYLVVIIISEPDFQNKVINWMITWGSNSENAITSLVFAQKQEQDENVGSMYSEQFIL